jgi:GNAT superfamily N-acetyltransferase
MAIDYRTELPPIEKYAVLYESSGWSFRRPVTSGVLQMALEKSWYCVFAWDGEALVGAGRVVTDGVLHAIIYDVIVAPDYQGRGIGAQIMGRIMQKCLDADIGTIQLFCAQGKQGFYEKLGFTVRAPDAPGMQYTKRQ